MHFCVSCIFIKAVTISYANMQFRFKVGTQLHGLGSCPILCHFYFFHLFFVMVNNCRSSDWNNNDRDIGNKCYNETQPVMEKGYIGFGTDKRIMWVVEDVVGRMKVVVSILNITQMSEYRKDGHASVYTDYGGKRSTMEKQTSDPKQYADCIHWCLPGLPDVWNQLLYSFLWLWDIILQIILN